MEHELMLKNKTNLMVTAVVGVDSFDEQAIFIHLEQESLNIYGENLHIENLDLEEGTLVASGSVETIQYTKKKMKKSIWERFRK